MIYKREPKKELFWLNHRLVVLAEQGLQIFVIFIQLDIFSTKDVGWIVHRFCVKQLMCLKLKMNVSEQQYLACHGFSTSDLIVFANHLKAALF